jgi:hypothetical protein
MDKRAQIAKVLITLRSRSTARSTRRAPNPATGCDPDRDVAGRELEWRVGDHDFSRRAYTRKCVSRKDMAHLRPVGGYCSCCSSPADDDIVFASWRTPSPTRRAGGSLCLPAVQESSLHGRVDGHRHQKLRLVSRTRSPRHLALVGTSTYSYRRKQRTCCV